MLSGRQRKWLVGGVIVMASVTGLWNLSGQIVSNTVIRLRCVCVFCVCSQLQESLTTQKWKNW